MLRMASPGRIMELSKDLTLRVGERGDGRSAGRWTGAAAIIKWDRNAACGSTGTWFAVVPRRNKVSIWGNTRLQRGWKEDLNTETRVRKATAGSPSAHGDGHSQLAL